MLQGDVCDAHREGQGDGEETLTALKRPALPRVHLRLTHTHMPEYVNCVHISVCVCVCVFINRCVTCITVRGHSEAYHSGTPNRLTHGDLVRYVSDLRDPITIAPTHTLTHT